jgi:hypothetical protein
MKKTTANPILKLKLNRETLRALEQPQLEVIVGGTVRNSDCSVCASNCGGVSCFC